MADNAAMNQTAAGVPLDSSLLWDPSPAKLISARVHEYFYGTGKSFVRKCEKPYAEDRENWLRSVEPQYTHSAGCILRVNWAAGEELSLLERPLPIDLLETALRHHEGYASNWRGFASDAVYLSNPPRLFLKTPDGPDFLFFGICHSLGDRFAGVLIGFSNNDEEQESLCSSLEIPIEWQRTNLPLAIIPLKILQRRWWITIGKVFRLMGALDKEERGITRIGEDSIDLAASVRQLHLCNSSLLDLERRWNFERKLAAVILAVLHEARDAGSESLSTSSAYRKTLSESTTLSETINALGPEIDILPRRIQNALTALYNLNAQQDTKATIALAAQSREIAQQSREIAAATLRDSSAMKTIAAMTLIFLPATFLSSFFSMSFFDWHTPASGSVTASLWVYFAVAVPLTVVVIAGWIVTTPFMRRRFMAWMKGRKYLEKLDNAAGKEV